MYYHVALMLSAFAPFVAAGNICTDGGPYLPQVIRTLADVAQYEQCSLIKAGLVVHHEYKGSFELRGPKNIGGFEGGNRGGSDQEPGQVTDISLPDLETVDYVWILNAPYLENISFPKLRSSVGGQGIYITLSKGSKISFPSLESVADWLGLYGAFDEVELPALKEVNSLKIKTSGNFDCIAYWEQAQKSLTLTNEHQDFSPAFECESAINVAKSALIPRELV